MEVATSPNWVPCWVLDGDTKPGPCASGVNTENFIRSLWVGETGGSERSEYVGGMGAVGTTAGAACLASGEAV